ncbi:MAG TPA: hypothetical protein VFP20_00730 [Bacteroidales bacterium]|nr:hypothetical protein [Bacteroidales bacterium]
MNKLVEKILWMALPVLFATACTTDDRSSLDTSGDTDIHAFTINGVEGTIDSENSTISLILPSGTNLQGLVPSIAIGDGAQISPNTGESVDFANAGGILTPVTYTVSNKDSYQKYKVTVDVAKAKITSLKIGSVVADIDEATKKILIYLPLGTDVTSLIPVVEYTSGATITPLAGNPVNFTSPVNFTLAYLGSTFTYEVTVKLGDKPLPNLVIYNGETVSPTWSSIASTINNGYLNPKTDGINTTSTCIAITRRKEGSDDGGRPWSGGALWNANKVNIDPKLYDRITVMILKSVAGTVQLEIQSDGEANKDWLKVSYSADALGKWQELTFMIPSSRTAMINNILVAPHVDDSSGDPNFVTQLMYWDQLIAHPKP